MKRFVLFFGMILMAGCLPEKSSDKSEIPFAKETIRILRQDRPAVVFKVEIADTNAKRSRGLMYRTNIKTDEDKTSEWDELEKSIIAKLATDVLVGVLKDKVEILIVKDFN